MTFLYTVFGWPLGWIMYVCYSVVMNYGLALIIFTVITKLLQLPIAINQQKSMMKTAIFRPQMEALQRKYKNNQEKLNEEMMKLYQKENYNPMSGCLPMLISFPILFGMIDVIYKPITHIIRPGKELIAKATEMLTAMNLAPRNTMTSEISIIKAIKADPSQWMVLGEEFVTKAQEMNFTFLGIDLTEVPTLMPEGKGIGVWLLLLLVPILSGVTSFLISIQSQRHQKTTMGDNPAGGGMMVVNPMQAKTSLEEEKAGLEASKLALAEIQSQLEVRRTEADALLAALGGDHLIAVGVQHGLDHAQDVAVVLHNENFIFVIGHFQIPPFPARS